MDLILLFGALLIVSISSLLLRGTYSKYKEYDVVSNYTGYEAAKKILQENGLDDIDVVKISGELTDNYNNSKGIISLSSDIYEGKSIASVSVAAHECGHAIQYKEGYIPIKLRNILVPFVNIGNSLGYFIIMISIAASITKLFMVGLILISFALIFQLITLPCEFDASRRGKKKLLEYGIITNEELDGSRKVLLAAAFTYVAGLLSSIMQILRLVLLFTGNRRND